MTTLNSASVSNNVPSTTVYLRGSITGAAPGGVVILATLFCKFAYACWTSASQSLPLITERLPSEEVTDGCNRRGAVECRRYG
jgi:hypothetical protein